jgi:hypothetical protein
MKLQDTLSPDSAYLVELEKLKRRLLRWMLWSGLIVVACVVLGVWRISSLDSVGPTPGSALAVLRLLFGSFLLVLIVVDFCIFAGVSLTYGRVMTRIMAARSIRDTMAAMEHQGLPPMTAHLLAERAWNKRMLRRTGTVMVFCAAVMLGVFSFLRGGILSFTLGLAGLCAPTLFLWSSIRFAIAGVRLLRSGRPGIAAGSPLAFTSEAD